MSKSQQQNQQAEENNDNDEDMEQVSSIKDYLSDLFKDERLEVARVKNQDRGDTELIKKDQMVDKLDRQNRMNQVAKMLKDLSWEERFEWIHQQKIKGNRFFKKGQYQEAADIYVQGLMGIEFKIPDPVIQSRMEQENILPLLTNVATTLIKLKKYENASAVCDKALSIDPQSIKANCKKGESLMYCRFYDQSVVYLKKALELAKKDVDKINILRIYKKLKIMKKNEQNVYKQMFPPSEAAKNEQEMNLLVEQSKNNGLSAEHKNHLENEEEEDEDEEDQNSDEEESCDEDENGYEYQKIKQKKNKTNSSEQNIKILEYNDQIEAIKQYIGPLSFLMIVPIKIYQKIATVIGCKRRKEHIKFESDSEENDEYSQNEDAEDEESD
ncbi:tetratricopeptide repeat protein (macronuclear) [Tetrahymena thermophila SB210]|uniref:Tetratricopeptide repeat protein n=1 Tax=Tetrahymena thermophila (strain SB210) TaxID=312017 RepID=Q23TD4_TETTS|nr:tetratricopeptide repeat protein [Tetrahymena thermophila SB210]EAR99772.1 tetratricopeptide repeat protein [Tetrahymena thermophila SB210]|eukprot:XP_001020017.1 tetratricopeptide repeat protein [Tetrahymena thermophila SB210]